ncbi:MAG: type II secretion system GspH family protein [Burkholderiales bacterium]|jgi:prepilin-type N-terminal cleavage/methylation domain-containing protein|nr:type II secretion system GspH family protein [Burkholderiales bacterium]
MVSGVGLQQRGFSLLELAFVLVVIGVLGLFARFAFSGADDVRQQQQAKAQAEVVREALRYYVLANKRLPCPDFNADGYEDRDSTSEACSGGGEIGFVPYHSLGLTPSEENRMTYGVYRAASPNDITFLTERTDDLEGAPGYMGVGDAIVALREIPATVSGTNLFVAGINADGSSNCAAAVSVHPAFVLIVPNTDRDGDGNLLDGVNADTTKCIASPLQPLMWNYDDVVAVESPNALIGWLTEHIH